MKFLAIATDNSRMAVLAKQVLDQGDEVVYVCIAVSPLPLLSEEYEGRYHEVKYRNLQSLRDGVSEIIRKFKPQFFL